MADFYLVSTPIGNLGDVTRRAEAVLGRVSMIYAEDTRRTRTLLDHLGVDTPIRSLHAHNEAARVGELLGRLDAGQDVALVSDAGTPLVSDPGQRAVAAAVERDHRVVPVPGASAVLAALTGSGLPVDRFTFLGFLPRKGRARTEMLERIAGAAETVVVFESPERLVQLLSVLEERCGPGRAVSIARELTKVHEEFFRGTTAEARLYYESNPPRGEVTVVVAPAEVEVPDEDRALELARRLMDQGELASAAAKEIARRMGLSRNRAYRIVQAARKDDAC